MSYIAKIGTIEVMWNDNKAIPVGYVLVGDILPKNPVWDAILNNIRSMTAAEIAALPAQKQAARDSAEPDLVALRDQAIQAIADINTFLAILAPTNVQVLAEVRAADIRQRAMIRAIMRLATRALS
jgi:hypothetical protein